MVISKGWYNCYTGEVRIVTTDHLRELPEGDYMRCSFDRGWIRFLVSRDSADRIGIMLESTIRVDQKVFLGTRRMLKQYSNLGVRYVAWSGSDGEIWLFEEDNFWKVPNFSSGIRM